MKLSVASITLFLAATVMAGPPNKDWKRAETDAALPGPPNEDWNKDWKRAETDAAPGPLNEDWNKDW
jgi:hypothetical protein